MDKIINIYLTTNNLKVIQIFRQLLKSKLRKINQSSSITNLIVYLKKIREILYVL